VHVIVSDSMSIEGVVQVSGQHEDTDCGFAHGGWSMPYFDARRATRRA